MKNLYVIVSRNAGEETDTRICDDFIEACANQLSMLVGAPTDVCKAFLKKETLEEIKQRLLTYGRDRLANDEEEVYIFFMPSRESFR